MKEITIKVKPFDPDRPPRPQLTCYKCGHTAAADTFVDLQQDDLTCVCCGSRNVN